MEIVTTTNLVSPTDYRQIVEKLHEEAANYRQPINGTFELTDRCNLSCCMCYVRQSIYDKVYHKKEISANQWLDLARQAVDCGMFFLLLTGGEIFVRPDFFDIYTPLTRMGINISLFTNATLISETIAMRLAEAPPSRTEVTLYGATADVYDAVTGVPGSYANCCAGIEMLVKHRIPLNLKTTLTRYNINELEAMKQMAHNWGVSLSSAWLLSKRRDGTITDLEDCRISPTDCVQLITNNNTSVIEQSETKSSESSLENKQNFYCQAGKASFVINSQGKMNVCISLPLPASSPLEIGFRAAWQKVQDFIDDSPPLSPICLKCELRNFCNRCPAFSLTETGNLSEPVPYLCEIARLRKNCAKTK
jgi:radical SAM protein with 4Fe4S-binding SPASM domain